MGQERVALAGKGVATYLLRFVSYREEAERGPKGVIKFAKYRCLNGRRLREVDAEYLKKLRNGNTKTASWEKMDEWSVYYDLPLWEIEEAGGLVVR